MVRVNENALICDLAETYQIYDYKQLPPLMVAVFACGLRDDSRIKLELSDVKAKPDTILLATIVDCLNILIWAITKDGAKNRSRPKSIVKLLFDLNDSTDKKINFATGEDFEKARKKLLRRIKEG